MSSDKYFVFYVPRHDQHAGKFSCTSGVHIVQPRIVIDSTERPRSIGSAKLKHEIAGKR